MAKKTASSLRVPVTREPNESTQYFGQRRRRQIRQWYTEGMSVEDIRDTMKIDIRDVKDALDIRTERYAWYPPPDILTGPFPTREQALREEPLISSNPRRMPTDQAIARAIQFWRWYNAGLTYKEIGDRHGISRERVRKVLEKYGFPSHAYLPDWRSGKPPRLPLIIDDIRETTYRRTRRRAIRRD